MRILTLDDSESSLERLTQALVELRPHDEVRAFTDPYILLDFAKANASNIAFLDIEMWGMNGLQVAKSLKEINPKINIVFVTAYSEYMQEAFSLYPSGYVLKPICTSAVQRELDNLRHPVDYRAGARVFVQTFGNFEFFIQGKPICFARTKTKELLAYLIDRKGAVCSNSEIMAVIWDDRADTYSLKSQFRHLVADLRAVLKHNGIEEILRSQRGALSVDTGKFQCDAYDFFKGITAAVNLYGGEYMTQYSWAELTNAHLLEQSSTQKPTK